MKHTFIGSRTIKQKQKLHLYRTLYSAPLKETKTYKLTIPGKGKIQMVEPTAISAFMI